MKPFVFAAGLALAAAAHAAEPGPWSFDLASERHSDPLPLAALDGASPADLRPRAGRNLVYAEDSVRASRRWGDWQWSLLARQSATIVANEDALRLARQVDGAGTASSARWQVDARFRAFAGAGAEVARAWPLAEGWQLDTAVQALVLGRWRERTLSGPASFEAATATTPAAYRFDLATGRIDDHADEPFQQPFGARGQALLADLGLRWQRGPWQARVALQDLGWLHWRGVPQQQATLSTDTQATDADGFLVYGPLVQGQNSQAGLTRQAPLRGLAELGWQATPEHRVQVAVRRREGVLLPALGWQTQQGALQAGAQWHWHEQRLTLHARWQGWQLRLGGDRLGAGARSRELVLGWMGAL